MWLPGILITCLVLSSCSNSDKRPDLTDSGENQDRQLSEVLGEHYASGREEDDRPIADKPAEDGSVEPEPVIISPPPEQEVVEVILGSTEVEESSGPDSSKPVRSDEVSDVVEEEDPKAEVRISADSDVRITFKNAQTGAEYDVSAGTVELDPGVYSWVARKPGYLTATSNPDRPVRVEPGARLNLPPIVLQEQLDDDGSTGLSADVENVLKQAPPPDSQGKTEWIRQLYSIGDAKMAARDFETARRAFWKVRGGSEDEYSASLNLAVLYFLVSQPDSVDYYLNEVRGLMPNIPVSGGNRAQYRARIDYYQGQSAYLRYKATMDPNYATMTLTNFASFRANLEDEFRASEEFTSMLDTIVQLEKELQR
ncbi:MAG: carboxypeptidase-like regulatory domain-containing protein [Rhodothermales bacterium]